MKKYEKIIFNLINFDVEDIMTSGTYSAEVNYNDITFDSGNMYVKATDLNK